jgi:hypothetical protein
MIDFILVPNIWITHYHWTSNFWCIYIVAPHLVLSECQQIEDIYFFTTIFQIFATVNTPPFFFTVDEDGRIKENHISKQTNRFWRNTSLINDYKLDSQYLQSNDFLKYSGQFLKKNVITLQLLRLQLSPLITALFCQSLTSSMHIFFRYGTEIRMQRPGSASPIWPRTWPLGLRSRLTRRWIGDRGLGTRQDLKDSNFRIPPYFPCTHDRYSFFPCSLHNLQ